MTYSPTPDLFLHLSLALSPSTTPRFFVSHFSFSFSLLRRCRKSPFLSFFSFFTIYRTIPLGHLGMISFNQYTPESSSSSSSLFPGIGVPLERKKKPNTTNDKLSQARSARSETLFEKLGSRVDKSIEKTKWMGALVLHASKGGPSSRGCSSQNAGYVL